MGADSALTAELSPANATNKALSWASSDPDIATVDANGKVSGVSPGTATITVSTAEGGKTDACAVTVFSAGIQGVRDYLGTASGGASADDPVSLILSLDLASDWSNLLTEIQTANKFVALDLSACTMSGTEFNPGTANTGESKIVSLVLPAAAASIKAGTYSAPTFKNFTALAAVSGTGVTSVGECAFYGEEGTALETLSLPEAVSIGGYAFSYGLMETVDLPKAVSIGEFAFGLCRALETVDLPVATNIGLAAFAGTALSTLSLPEALSIGGQAFRGCTALETLSLPKAASIGQYAFWGTGGQALEITLGAAAPTLGPQMFYDVAVLKSVTVKVPSSGATGYGSIPAAYTETNSPYTINWGNGFRGGGWNGSAMLSYDVNSNITLRVVSEGYPYDSVTVNLPGLEDGKVEQPLSGGTTFYGPGAVFTATVSGSSVASQTVAWSVNGTNLDAETTITGGVLSVAAADHGKTITVTATSAEDGITSGKVNIAVAVVMPSDFYGTWTASDFGITWTLVFTSADVHCSKSNSAQYTVTFTGITGVLNTINASKADYPAGFRFTGTAGNVSGPSTGGWDADGPVNVVDGGSGPLTVCLHKTDKGMMLQKSLSTPFAKQL